MTPSTTWRNAIAALAVTTALLTGCEPVGDFALPEHFVKIDDPHDRDEYDVRGVSADGVVLGVRSEENLSNGTLAFWTEAMTNELTGRGYTLESTEDVTSAAGAQGKLLTWSTTSHGRSFTYVQALLVTQRNVTIAEAGGRSKAMAARSQDIRDALLSAK
jgi:hypothetical protein